MNNKHNPALDGLRWLAFLGVFLFHADEVHFHYGALGVQLFFVLSGFLIGSILLTLRDRDALPLSQRLKDFYIRRSLRIFPLYYFVLLCCLLLSFVSLSFLQRRNLLPWHAAYLTNFYLFYTGAKIDSETHFWSLCVEEHFYLLVPLFMLRASYRNMERGVVLLLLLTTMGRLANYCWWHYPRFYMLSPMQFDILAMGIAIAIIQKKGEFLGVTTQKVLRVGIGCAITLSLLWLVQLAHGTRLSFIDAVLIPPLFGVACAALVLALWTNQWSGVSRVLAWPPFVYLGRISYGLYIYHNFLLVIARNAKGPKFVVLTVVELAATIVVASASWFLLERPFNNLKRFFPYSNKPPASTLLSAEP